MAEHCNCAHEHINSEQMENANVDDLIELAELFKVFADSTRIQIMHVLMKE